MQLTSEKTKWFLFSVAFAVAIFLVLVSIFGSLKVTATPTDAKITIDNKTVKNQNGQFTLIGKHTLTVSKDGYITVERKISIHPGDNNEKVNLQSSKQAFIDKLPINNDYFLVSYVKDGDFFYVTIKTEDTQSAKNNFYALLDKNNLKANDTKIVWDYIAGVNGRTGP